MNRNKTTIPVKESTTKSIFSSISSFFPVEKDEKPSAVLWSEIPISRHQELTKIFDQKNIDLTYPKTPEETRYQRSSRQLTELKSDLSKLVMNLGDQATITHLDNIQNLEIAEHVHQYLSAFLKELKGQGPKAKIEQASKTTQDFSRQLYTVILKTYKSMDQHLPKLIENLQKLIQDEDGTCNDMSVNIGNLVGIIEQETFSQFLKSSSVWRDIEAQFKDAADRIDAIEAQLKDAEDRIDAIASGTDDLNKKNSEFQTPKL